VANRSSARWRGNQIQQGKASPSLSAIVEVGRTDDRELAMDLAVQKRATVEPPSLEVKGRNEESDPADPLANESVEVSTSLPSYATEQPLPDDLDRDRVEDGADTCPASVP